MSSSYRKQHENFAFLRFTALPIGACSFALPVAEDSHARA